METQDYITYYNLLQEIISWNMIFILVILVICFYGIIKPVLLIQFYKNQGFNGIFVPIVGSFILDIIKSKQKYKDPMQIFRERIIEDPNLKGIVYNMGSDVVLDLIDPKLIKDFYQYQEIFPKYERFAKIFKNILGKTGLGFVEGSLWRSRRRLISTIFHFEFLQSYVPVMQKTARKWLQNIPKDKLDKVTILHEFQEIVGLIICQIFFGDDLTSIKFDGHSLSKTFLECINKGCELEFSWTYLVFGAKLAKLGLNKNDLEIYKKIDEIRQLITNIIRKRRATFDPTKPKTRPDFTELLLKASLTNPEYRLNDSEIVTELMGFLFAGVDTTSHTLEMALYYLSQNDDLKQRVFDDIKNHYDFSEELKIETLNKMEVMNALFKETLRVAGPAQGILFRVATKDLFLGNVKVKKGTILNVTFTYNFHNPKYHDNPEQFSIDRWLDPNSTTMLTMKTNPFAYTPFSAGGRICLGQHFALIASRILLSEFMNIYEFKMDRRSRPNMVIRSLYEAEVPIELSIKSYTKVK